MTGQPLNCTDIEVGPEGAVYFTTGGRGTQGGLYRVSWNEAPHKSSKTEPSWVEAIKLDSPLASFSQRKADELRGQNRQAWDQALPSEVRDPDRKRSPEHRIRALEILCQTGPEPSEELLIDLSSDADSQVRSRALGLLGRHTSDRARAALVKALSDPDPFARRHACEGLMQQPAGAIPVDKLTPLLADPDRSIRFAARVAIEHADLPRYRAQLLSLTNSRASVEAMLAVVRATRLDQAAQEDLLNREIGLLTGRPDPEVERDLLRLIELTILLGPKKAEAAPLAALKPHLLSRFSTSTDSPINREIARLLAFLDEPRAVAAIVAHQATVPDRQAEIHDAYCLRAIKHGWTAKDKEKLWAWFETASRWEGGFSFAGYLDYMVQELVERLTESERDQFLARGEAYPFPTRVLVRELNIEREARSVPALVSLYRRVVATPGASSQGEDLRSIILEKLGRTRLPDAHAALRELAALDPARHDQLVRALADHPSQSDLPLLISALASRDPNTTNLVINALRRIKASPEGPEGLAGLIRLARRSGPSSRHMLDDLASRWTGTTPPPAATGFDQVLSAWEDVFHKRFPKAGSLSETELPGAHTYDLAQLIENVMRGDAMKTASVTRGAAVITRARCLDCHKFGEKGAGLGPDLTTVNSRFRPTEILESIVQPSKVVSDQYKSVSVATQDGKVYGGMPIVSDGPNLVLLLSDGTKVTIPKTEVDEQKASTTSVMPEGLLNPLSYQEIADLLALFESMPRVAAPEAAAGKGK